MGSFTRLIKFVSCIRELKLFYQKHDRTYLHFYHPVHRHYSCTKHLTRSTIFALSTPPGVSAIAVIRISGPHASNVLHQMGKLQMLPHPRKAILCKIWDPESEELLDKALALWFPNPSSFTGEDICELHVHGGVAVVKSVLKALSKMDNFRLAEPGEFTKRAFMANKLDLTEIEGLADLLHAETEIQQRQALRQMDGVLYKLYSDWSDRIKKCLANIEAYIDFSEDQHLDNSSFDLVHRDLQKLQMELSNHLSDNRRGERLRTGVFTVLIGRPNVGKSSLLNSLCQRDIAIVSPTAGTTRDIIETSFNLGGYLVNISDTAGIRETEDLIEIEGVKRAKDRSSKADLRIFILEAKRVLEVIESNSISPEILVRHLLNTELGEQFIKDLHNFEKSFHGDLLENDKNDHIILLLNKIDLLNEDQRKGVSQLEDMYPYICCISCTEGTGMNKFLNLFTKVVEEMCSSHGGEEPTLTQERHRLFVQNCLQSISEFEEWVNVDVAIAAEKLRIAMNELGKITGKVLVDDILDVIFRDFCIGK